MSGDLVTHLQFFVLRSLIEKELSGVDIRSLLETVEVKQTRAAFYQLMARLVDAQLVNQRSESATIRNQSVTQSVYSITKKGRSEVQKSVEFYRKGEK